MPRLSLLLTCLVLGFVPATLARADDATYKNGVWSIGATVGRFDLQGDDDNDLVGASGLLRLGLGYLGEQWYGVGETNLVLGPYTQAGAADIKTDFVGTGFSSSFGKTFFGPLRAKTGSFGVSLGFDYMDMVGRSVSRSALSADGKQVDNYVMRSTLLAVLPGFFYSRLKPARLRGNDPELLLTRIEGYFLNVAFSYPVISSYTVKYTESDEASDSETNVRESGNFSGYGLFLAFTALLGV